MPGSPGADRGSPWSFAGGAAPVAGSEGLAACTRLGHEAMQAGAVALVDQLAEDCQARAVAVELLEERRAVGERDVAPHFGRARCDAGEVAESAGGEAEEL